MTRGSIFLQFSAQVHVRMLRNMALLPYSNLSQAPIIFTVLLSPFLNHGPTLNTNAKTDLLIISLWLLWEKQVKQKIYLLSFPSNNNIQALLTSVTDCLISIPPSKEPLLGKKKESKYDSLVSPVQTNEREVHYITFKCRTCLTCLMFPRNLQTHLV